MEWTTPRRTLTFDRLLIMGIVNVTPDSFSDGGDFHDPDAAIAHAMQLIRDGADILDIGGESTRPGATPVPAYLELKRVLPVVRELAKSANVPISIDTSKPTVAFACLTAGAEIVNDVTGLRDDDMREVVRSQKAAAVVMHMQGTPQTMQDDPKYDNVVAEVREYLQERIIALTRSGIDFNRIAIDAGIGFGKKSTHNWQLIAGLPQMQALCRPIVLGVSRKGFLGKDVAPQNRLNAGLAVACHAFVSGAAQVIRTHDVKATREAFDALSAIRLEQSTKALITK